MFERVALVHYHEIGLKGRNRAVFERRLRDNLDAALGGLGLARAERIASRLIVAVPDPSLATPVAERLSAVPGVNSVSLAYKTARDVDEIDRAALLSVEESRRPDDATFKVDSRRSNTDFPVTSLDLNRQVGEYVRMRSGLGVDLSRPDVVVSVEVVQGDAYVYSGRIPGPGGLPVGTAGKVISLLSAGIDSPVASWRLIRRGAVLVGVHFSGRPQTNDSSERTVVEIGRVLERTGGLGRIYLIPFGDVQRRVSLASPPDLRVLLYRRLMLRVAEQVAGVENAKALVTGESLGQVASQTLENVGVVDQAAALPVLRPLIGSDKLEIIAEARRIGTYDLSIQEHDDCCTLFMPRNPETHARIEPVLAAEEGFDSQALVAECVDAMTWRDFASRSYRAPRRWPSA